MEGRILRRKANLSGEAIPWQSWCVLLAAPQEERENCICQFNKQIKVHLASLMVLSNLNWKSFLTEIRIKTISNMFLGSKLEVVEKVEKMSQKVCALPSSLLLSALPFGILELSKKNQFEETQTLWGFLLWPSIYELHWIILFFGFTSPSVENWGIPFVLTYPFRHRQFCLRLREKLFD